MEAQEYSLPSDTDKNLHNSAPISVRYYQFFEKKTDLSVASSFVKRRLYLNTSLIFPSSNTNQPGLQPSQ